MTGNTLGVRGRGLAAPSWKMLPKSCLSVCLGKTTLVGNYISSNMSLLCPQWASTAVVTDAFNSWFWDTWKANEMESLGQFSVEKTILLCINAYWKHSRHFPHSALSQGSWIIITYQDKLFHSRNILVCQELSVVCLSQLFYMVFLSCLLNLFQTVPESLKDKWAFWSSAMPPWTQTPEKLHYKLFILTPAMKMAYNWLI